MSNTKLEIIQYMDIHYDLLEEMLDICFNQDYNIPLTEKQLEELCKEISIVVVEGIVFLDLLFIDGEVTGFINYQVDTPESDWCEKENWGCIRETYISPNARKKGYGKELVKYTENKLWDLNVPNIYLTTDYTIDFWVKMGYRNTGEICDKNDGNILVK